MSRLEELIREFCPDGVEYVNLGDVCQFESGYPLNAKGLSKSGQYNCIKISEISDGRIIVGNDFVNELPSKIKPSQFLHGSEILVGMSGSTGKCGFNYNIKDAIVNQRIGIIRNRDNVLIEYLRHLLVNQKFSDYCYSNGTGPQKNVSKNTILNYIIPVPPLPVQREIVRILDSFTDLTAELETQLTAELEARKKQYEYYRDQLLNFDAFPDGVEYRVLQDCCLILDNKRQPVTKSARESGEYPYYGANGIQDYVSDYIFDGACVLVGEDGSVVTDKGTPVVTWATGKIWVNNHAHIISEKNGVSIRFLFHYIQTVDVKPLIHGNIPKLTGTDFRNIKVPVLPLDEQQRIVSILDRFDTLCNDLTSGLPAEIAARQKQYEYYRDKLLAFPLNRSITHD